jgi:hypothetical protein
MGFLSTCTFEWGWYSWQEEERVVVCPSELWLLPLRTL